MSAVRGLGRGFESLIPTDLTEEEFDPTAQEDREASELKSLKVTDIEQNPEQPRKEFDREAMEALAASIKEHGVLQPVVVVRAEDKYQLVAGERRWRAAKMAGLTKIPALIRTIDAQNQLELSIIENAQREDLNAIELATAYAKLAAQFNLSPKEIGRRVGKSEAAVRNTLRLLELPESAKRIMLKQRLTEGVMRPLVAADPKVIEKVLPRIVAEGWTTRRVEQFMTEQRKPSSERVLKTRLQQRTEEALSGQLGVQVWVKGKQIVLVCQNKGQVEKLLKELAGLKGVKD